MKYIAGLLKRYPLSTALALVIWVLCLAPLPETPLDNVRLIDKWTHLVMFGSLTAVIWWEYLRRHRTLNPARLFLLAFLAPVVMGGLVELAQAYAPADGAAASGSTFSPTRSAWCRARLSVCFWRGFAAGKTGRIAGVPPRSLMCETKNGREDNRH